MAHDATPCLPTHARIGFECFAIGKQRTNRNRGFFVTHASSLLEGEGQRHYRRNAGRGARLFEVQQLAYGLDDLRRLDRFGNVGVGA